MSSSLSSSLFDLSNSDSLLSLKNACSICLLAPRKYKCPACSAQTCSAVCSRRHKARTGCSGVRDVTAFAKKTDLQHKSIVQESDYNFLANIQRSIHRGPLADESTPRGEEERGQQPAAALKHALRKQEVQVRSAPKGFKRAMENETRSTKRRCLMWTIEWLRLDGTRTVKNEVSDATQVEDAFLGKSKTTNPNGKPQRGGKKEVKAESADIAKENEKEEVRAEKEEVEVEVEVENANGGNEEEDVQQDEGEGDGNAPPEADAPQRPDAAQAEQKTHKYRFFLKHHNPPDDRPTLRELRADSTLRSSLRGSTVLEYPTIYVIEEGESISDLDIPLSE